VKSAFERTETGKSTRPPETKLGPRILHVPVDATRKPEGIFEAHFPNSTKPIEEWEASGPLALDPFFFSVNFGLSFVFEVLISEWCCCSQ
jgi:hypothetical protein